MKKEASYKTVAQADDAYQAKRFPDALAAYDDAIKDGAVQADVLAEIHLKRGVCKIETGDFVGAEEDLAQAERGGAVGDDYARAMKRLAEKKGGS